MSQNRRNRRNRRNQTGSARLSASHTNHTSTNQNMTNSTRSRSTSDSRQSSSTTISQSNLPQTSAISAQPPISPTISNEQLTTPAASQSPVSQHTSNSRCRSIFTAIKRFVKAIGKIIVVSWAILTVLIPIGWVSLGKEWDQIIKESTFVEKHKFLSSLAISRWEDTINKIRLNESREYIEDILGIPQMSEINKYSSEDQIIEYQKDVYVNHYFTLICIYVEGTLQGFLIIGNREDMHLKSYRGDLELFTDSIYTASEKCDEMNTYYNFVSGNSSNRLDSNQYYVECRTQHSAGAVPNTLIGYGYCDLSNTIDHRNEIQIPISITYRYDDYTRFGWPNSEEVLQLINDDLNNDDVLEFKQNTPLNVFFIFNDNGILLKDSLVIGYILGMSKDSYYNLCDDYTAHLNEEIGN